MKLSEVIMGVHDWCDVPLRLLYGFENAFYYYYLTKLDLIYNVNTEKYCAIHIHQNGYPCVSIKRPGYIQYKTWTFPLHKVIALARINNGPYEEIEHLNDDPHDLRYCNLMFSTHRQNTLRAFINGKRDCPSRIFRVTLLSGEIFEGTMLEIQNLTGISRATLYDNFYKNKQCKNRRNCLVKSVELIQEAPPQKHLSNRFTDYRKGSFQGKIYFENFVLDYE